MLPTSLHINFTIKEFATIKSCHFLRFVQLSAKNYKELKHYDTEPFSTPIIHSNNCCLRPRIYIHLLQI